ncbi:MAG: hypothetical protein IJX12_03295 [Lachnospiraceae bacterium]|nr:hypothetical protein [Lachnospiraceae bacterium]
MAEAYYIGMDLCSDSTQISFYNDIKREPETVNQLNNKETYMMPNILFYSKATGDWYVGSEASEARFKEDGVILDELYKNARSEEIVDVDGMKYTFRELFLLMLKMHINSFLYRYEGATVRKLVITIPEYSKDLYRVLSELYKELGIPEESVSITSHLDSGLYYIFNQSNDLWVNSVALFDYNADGLHYYRIDITRSKQPEVISVTHEDYSAKFNMALFGGDNLLMDDTFAKIADYEMKKTYISSVFLTGLGFSEKWMSKSRNILCQGRRVFAGQNIYTKGACYKAVGGEYEEFYKRFFVETSENVVFDIGISSGDEEDTFIPIAYGGKQWYNIRGKIYIILDDTDKLTIIYRNNRTDQEIREVVKLHGIPKRPNKTSKFSVEVEFEDPHRGAVVIKDVGFGKLFPTTNKIYRKEFEV